MKDLSDWRNEINDLDREIVAILNRRAACVLELAPLKRQQGIPVFEPDRERRVHDNIESANKGPLSTESLTRIYEAVMREMRELQNEPAE
jgi:chorismate mutase